MVSSFLSIGLGAVLVAWSGWGLGTACNHIFPSVPFGTLFANLIGSFLIGIMIVFTKEHHFFSENVRLGIITGFLGALTTFSTFSTDVVNLFSKQQYLFGSVTLLTNVCGALVMTLVGIYLTRALIT